MNVNDSKQWTLAYNRELLGKLFFKKAIELIINEKNFSQACTYIKNGLDYVTCDCTIGGWRNMYRNLETPLFANTEISELNDDNYYFCKAFVLSYEEDKESLNSALRAIIKYTYNNPDDYADYITGKIILNLGCPDAALLYFDKKSTYTKNKALFDYRFGRTKEQYLIDYGIDDLYNSFLNNYSSGCCLRVLTLYSRKHHIKIQANEKLILENEIVHNFIYDFDESDLQDVYENTIGKDHLTESELPIIENFIKLLKSNESLFLKPLDYEKDTSYYTHLLSLDNYPMDIMFENNLNENNENSNKIRFNDYDDFCEEDNESYDKYGGYNGYSDDIIDDVFDGDPMNTWNID